MTYFSERIRRIPAADGTWMFLPKRPVRHADGSVSPNPSMIVGVPGGTVIDVHFAEGTDPEKISDEDLLRRARAALRREQRYRRARARVDAVLAADPHDREGATSG